MDISSGSKATSSVPGAYLSPLEAWLKFDDPKLSQIISTRPSPRLLAPRTAHNFGVPSPRPRGTSLIPFRGRAREPHSISRKTIETNSRSKVRSDISSIAFLPMGLLGRGSAHMAFRDAKFFPLVCTKAIPMTNCGHPAIHQERHWDLRRSCSHRQP